MKRIFLMFFSGMLALNLTACQNNVGESSSESSAAAESTTALETSAVSSEVAQSEAEETQSAAATQAQQSASESTSSPEAANAQTGYTSAVPAEYKQSADKQGEVVELKYDSLDYLRDSAPITKTAYVYLPYGYDDNDSDTRYDIVYLMHGWGGHAGEYFEYTPTKNMFDNLIANGDIPPVIIVSASFYNENSDTDFSSSIAEFREFHRDFEDNLMPAVEGKYHTYAVSTSAEDLKASRDHRVFGGF